MGRLLPGVSVGLLTDSSWGGEARTLPAAPVGQQQAVPPMGRYELLTDLQVCLGHWGVLLGDRCVTVCVHAQLEQRINKISPLPCQPPACQPPSMSNVCRALRTRWVTWTSRWQVGMLAAPPVPHVTALRCLHLFHAGGSVAQP